MRSPRALATSLVTALVLFSSIFAVTPTAIAASAVRCTDTTLPVFLTLLPQTLHGRLCTPIDRTPKTVQLLVHGGTYNSRYWDLPHDSGRYSYQRDMAAGGFATFAVDLLGSGTSSQPLSGLLTGTTEASVVHQVVGKLKAGLVGGARYDRVVLVGHSMGSGIAVLEAGTYHDVDGVILTGMSHTMDLLALTGVFIDGVRPALLDPALSQRGGDPGYLTTMPTTRWLFHEPGEVEPGVLEADEATKDQVAATVVADLLPLGFMSPLSRAISAPVLMVNGDRDSLFCAFSCASEADFLASESPYFSAAAQLEAHLVPRAGHSVALATNAPTYRTAVKEWLNRRFAG